MEIEETPTDWGQGHSPDPSEPYFDPPCGTLVGSKRAHPFMTSPDGMKVSSPRFKRQLVSPSPLQQQSMFSYDAFCGRPMVPSVGLPSVHTFLAMSTPSTDASSQPIAIELSSCDPMSDRAAYAHILLVKTEDAPLGSEGGLMGPWACSTRCRDAMVVGQSLVRLRGNDITACLGRGIPSPAQHRRAVHVQLCEAGGVAVSPLSTPSHAPSPGCAIFLSLLHHLLPGGVAFRPRVAVMGELSLCGRVLSTGNAAARVKAALSAGMVNVVVPREDEAEVERELEPRHHAAVLYANDLLELLQHTVSGYFKRPCNVDLGRDVGVGPTLLPFDDVLVAFRWVEAVVLPRLPSPSSSSLAPQQAHGAWTMTGVQEEGNCVRSALNAARFLLLKHHAALSQLLGPPVIDLQYLRRLPGPAAAAGLSHEPSSPPSGPIDLHIHVPQPLHSAAYAAPCLLALISVVWGKEPTSKIVSVGEVNMLGHLEYKGMLRPSFVSALRAHRMRKVIIPRLHAMELVREMGGVGDRWAGCGGVVVQGAEGLFDLVRHAFLGGDDL